MRSKNKTGDQDAQRATEGADEPRSSQELFGTEPRHSDVVPKLVDPVERETRERDLRDTFAELNTQHLSWPEERPLRVPDETRSAWMSAYETSFDQAYTSWDRGDWLVPLVYAAGQNDSRLTSALLRFAYEVAVSLPDSDEALAILEVAQSTIDGEVGKDLCLRIAENLIDEAYERFAADRRFDRYFFCHCAAACARLAARVEHAESARDAIDAIQSAVAATRIHDPRADVEVPRLAARCIRALLGDSIADAAEVMETAPRKPHEA